MSKEQTGHDTQIDLDVIRERYEAERKKRLKPSGTDQYTFTDGKFAKFADDPYAPEPQPRNARREDLDVLVIGTGIGGIQLAAKLDQSSIGNFLLVDIAADFGGTWYWNRYPGLRCDVESYIYLPFLEETGYVPTERYTRGSEIFAYCQKLGRHFNLYERTLFQTKVTGITWNEDDARWMVTTSRGDELRARFVTTQSGIFGKPQLPGIPGIEDFAGCTFHSARWRYDYTGGGSDGGLDKLADKRVGIVGTGTTALQVVPELAAAAQEVTVFQRTPTAVGVRDNSPTDIEWFKSQPAGWQARRIKTFNALSMGENVDCPVDDGWARFFRRLIGSVATLPPEELSPEGIARAQEIADFAYNADVRARVDEFVRDPQKADLLKAYYRTMCKRPGFSDHYLPVFDLDHVKLVDVSGGIDRITADGVVVNGVEHKLDCLILCTGFELGTTWAHQAGYDVIGRDATKLSDKWSQGLITYHGLFSQGFPNMFFMGLTQTGITINVPQMLQEQADHLTFVIKHCIDNNIRTVDTTSEAEDSWQQTIGAITEARRPFLEACTPGYYNAEGNVGDRRSAIGSGWYLPSTQFFEMWSQWRSAGAFEGLVLEK
ncbi:Phenylacetone monooxygenase [Novosphingobium resinovorum]|uniref:Phenylacetone monooxygenase n=1 Tax=Novosphingobium resinovorum TaxID=158500 RepID=A0A031JQZ8_9SPHN|nr:NAD(P)/FAD-dependent oxidoreductase [Novosphingobium resinovorum]EZP79340.1 Phenylacetone monooxygenase [Novosphingobium resinovorum]